MKLNELIEHLHKLDNETKDIKFKKALTQVVNLVQEIENKNISNKEKVKIQAIINSYLEKIQTQKKLKLNFRKLKKSLKEDFGFLPPNYFQTLGAGVGIAMGSALGISFWSTLL
ncbi:hypothetical protein [uncultured Flavobacterium sp.]|uniref:hypothetical protein n=1 Tax=uncultured Flavobacterium sp. TaxID=165435 RepID=UPI0030EB45A3|tara:strand:+ start:50552 stop:50893 length:342 start_codon:yes stop_codon:yes gene_type:complete